MKIQKKTDEESLAVYKLRKLFVNIFNNPIEALFISRPNRFILHASIAGKEVVAHCPNPGRLTEILVPGRKLILEKSADKRRKTSYSLVGAFYKNKVVPLYSAKANLVARELVLPRLYPGALEIKSEAAAGHSRFDFKVTTPEKIIYIEVKACSLVEEGIAMFPDAPTARGLRHILELAELAKEKGVSGEILFIISHPDAKRFVPNIHTDPLFSMALQDVSRDIKIRCVSIRTTPGGKVTVVNHKVPIDLKPVAPCRRDEGSYLLLTEIHAPRKIAFGAAGEHYFETGFYVYTGSARRGLSKRVKRHTGKRKKLRWHIDYLTTKADRIKAYPLYTKNDIECYMAYELNKIAASRVNGFGCSDCACPSHLFYFREDPFRRQEFLDLFFRFRHRGIF